MRWFFIFILAFSPSLVSSQTTLELAKSYMDAGAYEKAETLVLERLRTTSDPEIQNMLGEIYGYQLQWDKSIDIYKELTLAYPQEPHYHFRYGAVMAKKAQESNPLVGLILLGRIKSSFKRALALKPNYLAAYWALIDIYVSIPGIVGGSYTKAYEYATSLKRISALDGYLALGYVYEYDGKPNEAKMNYKKALGLLDDLEVIERNQLNYQIGKICSELMLELDRGIIHLKAYTSQYTVLDGVPLEWAYFRLAEIYRQKSDKDEALMWIHKSLELSPDLKPALEEKIAIERL